MKLDHGGLGGLDARGRNLLVRVNYGTLLEAVLPIIAAGNARSQLPTELLGDSLLLLVREWESLPPQRAALLAVRLEQRNAEIVEADRLRIERPPASESPAASRPTRKGKAKRRPKAGRR